jgi:plasmid stabilization system protein ParE
MSFRVVYASEASLEFQEAAAWYEAQAAGLGIRFILAIDELTLAITSQPFRFPKTGNLTRKAKMPSPWPYSIFFAINETFSEIKIIAIWHGARNPSQLRQRLK